MDYEETETLFMFGVCERRKCVNITIENDQVEEETEFFDGILLRTPDDPIPSITLDPARARVEITDNDGM